MKDIDVHRLSNRTSPPEIGSTGVGGSPGRPRGVQNGPLAIELGVMRHFGSIDLGSTGLVSGWADYEEGHNWNNGCEAVLNVTASDPGQGCVIEFTGEPFLHELCPRQDVTLYVNGFWVSHWRLTEFKPYVQLARVEPEQLFHRDGSVLLKCAWVLPNSVKPADLGLSDDSRELAFCFRSLTISKI